MGGGREEKEASSSRGPFYCFRRENERRKGKAVCGATLSPLPRNAFACVRNGVGGACVEGREPDIKDGIEPEMEKVDRQNLLGPGAN